MSKAAPILHTQNVSVCYADGTVALSKVSIEIEPGKNTAILGGNGAGKSSLLLTFNGILKPGSGKVYFQNEPLSYQKKKLLALRKHVGVVFQSPDTQLFSASVFEDISFGLMNLGLPKQEAEWRVEEIMIKTGTETLRNKPTHCLSFGQKKRVALAGVLVMQPKVIVLDEPTLGLDPQGETEIMSLITRLAQELGLTLVIATHNMELVATHCHNAIVLSNGEMQFQGSVKEMFSHAGMLHRAKLRLTQVGELMHELKTCEGFEFQETALTISEARRQLKNALLKPNEKYTPYEKHR